MKMTVASPESVPIQLNLQAVVISRLHFHLFSNKLEEKWAAIGQVYRLFCDCT